MSEDESTQNQSHIPEDLLPYLQAANEMEKQPEQEQGQSQEDDQLALLRQLVEETMLVGADEDLLDEILADDGTENHEIRLDEATQEAEDLTAVRKIYTDLLARAPEHNFDPSLKRVAQVFDMLGDPQNSYPSIQVVGTNGKTSTTRMAGALLQAFGLTIGTFTSPHLMDVRERIQINGQPWSPARFIEAWEDVAPYIYMVDGAALEAEEPQISYFEALTITALAGFADEPVGAAVVEAGLGGSFDATSTIDAGVVVVTPISLDHQGWLGQTLEEIATEKAGAIKDKTIIVLSTQEPEILEIFQRKADETDSVVWLEGRDWQVLDRHVGVGGQMLDIKTPAGIYEGLFLPVHGNHQAHNAAAALVAVEAIMGGKALPPETVEEGMMLVRTPGRLELVRRSPSIVVDSAHNPAGVEAAMLGLREAFHFGYVVGVFAAMQDKNIEAMLVEAEPTVDHLVITQLPGTRAAQLEELRELAEDVFGPDRVSVEEEIIDALDKASALADEPADQTITRGIVVFGSVALAGEVTKLLV